MEKTSTGDAGAVPGADKAGLDDLRPASGDPAGEGLVFAATAFAVSVLAAGVAFLLVPVLASALDMARAEIPAALRVHSATSSAHRVALRWRVASGETFGIDADEPARQLLSTLLDSFSPASGRWIEGPAEGEGPFVELSMGGSKCHVLLHIEEAEKLAVALQSILPAH